MRITVIGGSKVPEDVFETAEKLGRILARRDHTVVCGGLTGVMEAVCKGARKEDGETVGILPTERRADANPYVETPIATGMGNARNVLVVMNGDAVIAIDGSTGTLSEIGHALDFGKPVVGIETHDVEGVQEVETPAKAVEYVEKEV